MLEYCRLYVGQRIDLTQVLEQLMRFGYERESQVADPGDVALHGGVLDIFPATFEFPLRIELAGSRIASIRGFNPVTTDTLDRHSMVVVLPSQLRMRVQPRVEASPEMPFEGCVDLEEGDLVVHIEHGIGRLIGHAKLSINFASRNLFTKQPQLSNIPRPRAGYVTSRGETEALVLEYADGDRLYVPMDQVHLLQKYVGFGSRAPTLHKLGGAAWERAKDKAYVGAWTYAKELINLQAKRLALPGHACSADHEWQRTFEQAFPYRETPDQLTATAHIKRDMERPRPMDRLLLGDVGYGKTEVALRAAFKTVMDHKQVVVLVPTTILAYQHQRTFANRMQGFPIRVEMLSRFQSAREQHQIIEALESGTCDIVIGTHRLLSGDVRFKDLGLLIIDEEQRFGISAKEQLKQWRTQLDVLVLSATPIPRTLYLALMGTRDMSCIMTPPEHRHPIETTVAEDEDASLRRWIRSELARQGQVYVVHPRVRDLHQIAARIHRLVPEARLSVGHGQMPEDALERTMVEFIEGRLDVLVTTTIIESGIDVPNANTLIVNRADQFGLADLYQLRGRVGRFTRRACAYLVVPRGAVLSQDSRERLRAIMQHTALGSGFNIAMEDLKLRGAGNLLGLEQHGHITAVGFDLYCRLLREAVSRLKPERSIPAEVG